MCMYYTVILFENCKRTLHFEQFYRGIINLLMSYIYHCGKRSS